MGHKESGLSVIPSAGSVQLTVKPANMIKAIDRPIV